jgi:hypothetical protein
MSQSPGRHASPEATPSHPDEAPRSGLANPKATRTVRFWTVPIVITLAVLAALAAFYSAES